jgi:hypothetical protein
LGPWLLLLAMLELAVLVGYSPCPLCNSWFDTAAAAAAAALSMTSGG